MSWYNTAQTLVSIVKRYPFEMIGLVTAIVCIVVASIFLTQTINGTPSSSDPRSGTNQPTQAASDNQDEDRSLDQPSTAIDDEESDHQMFVEISGAVIEPGLYQIEHDTRIGQVLEQAGGLSQTADRAFIARNINRAKRVVDGEKIHFPSVTETSTGVFQEPDRYLSYLSSDDSPVRVAGHSGSSDSNTSRNSGQQQTAGAPGGSPDLISINNASAAELESLPGIGEKTAEKIIESRPYGALTDLTDQDIVFDATFEKIADQIQL